MKKLIVALFGLMMIVVGWSVFADANFDFALSSNRSTAISGDVVHFYIDMTNNTGVLCTGYLDFSMDLGFSNVISNPAVHIEELWGVRQSSEMMFSLAAGSPSTRLDISALVQQWTWNDTFGIDMNGHYICSWETATTGQSAYLGREVELAVDKTAMSTPHNPGDDVDYLVRITNLGSENASDFEVYEVLPTDFFFWSMTNLARFNGIHRNGIERVSPSIWLWSGSYLNIPAGNPATTANNPLLVNIHGTLADDATIGDTMTNEAYISDIDAIDSNDRDSAVATVTNSDLSITIDPIGPEPMYDTDPMAWLITLWNNGNMDATNVSIDGSFDVNGVYPAGGTHEFVSNDWLDYSQSQNGNVVWSNVEWAQWYGTSFILTGYLNTGIAHPGDFICFNAVISADVAENLIDNAFNNEDILHNCHQVQEPLPPVDDVAFDLTLSNSDNPVNNGLVYGISGSVIDFDINISNTWSNPIEGFVQCQFPSANVMHVEPWTGSPVTRSWTQGGDTVEMDDYITIPNNGSLVNLHFQWTITDQSWTNFPITCRLYSGDTTPFLVDMDTASIDPIPELIIDKTMGDNPWAPGDLIDFDVTVTNIWSAPAVDYVFRDMPLPQAFFVFPNRWEMTFDGVTHPYSEYGATVFEREGTYLNLNPGEAMHVHGSLAMNDWAGIDLWDSFCNDARIQGLDLEYNTWNNTDQVCGLIASADLSLDIQAIGDSPEYEGDPVVFQINYANNWNVTGTNALLESWITNQVFGPSGAGQYLLTSSVDRESPVTLATGWALTWTSLTPIAPGESGTIIITWYLNTDTYLPGQPICLSWQFLSDYPETLNNLIVDNYSEACHYVTGEIADLVVTKDLLTDLSGVELGDPIAYRVTYGNIGSYDANTVSVVDTMPTALDINASNNLSYPAFCSHVDRDITCLVDDSTVAAWANGSFVITGYLNTQPDLAIALTNTWKISFPGREFNTGNNLTGRTDIIPGLADIYVYKTIIGEQPAVPGDTITYQIAYGNRGWRTAYNTVITDHLLFDGLDMIDSQPAVQNWDISTHSGYRAHLDLAAGQTWIITLTAELNDRYDAGTLLPNEAWITTDSAHTNIDWNSDEYSIVTWEIQKRQEVMVVVNAENITHPERNSEHPVWGVSGDLVGFTVHYINSGNVDLHNTVVTLVFPSTALWFDPTYEWTIWDLPFGSGGVFVVTGIVGPQGFPDVVWTARIWAQEFGIDPVDTDADRIIEKPMRCGDGFMTADEMCDFLSDGTTIGTVLPGQVCQSRAGIPAYGCEVVTESIINTGCIDYGFFINSNYMTGGYCVDVSSNVAGSHCENLATIEKTTQWLTGLDVQFLCEWTGTNDYTFITLDCGNGEYLTGFGAELEGTCHYTWAVDDATSFSAQCSVGTDTLNPNCQTDIDINAPEHASCDSLKAVHSNVLVVEKDEAGALQFSCAATSGLAQTMTIDCGSWQNSFTEHGVSNMTVACDYIGTWEEEVFDVSCLVNEEPLEKACKQPAIVTPPYLWYCGDGEMVGYEQCDLWDNGTIGDWLDKDKTRDAWRYANAGYRCENCAIKWGATIYQPPACFNVNTNISVMKNEILPFRWNLELNKSDLSDDSGRTCTPGDINKDTMECYFALYNGEHRQEDGDAITTFKLPCDADKWDSDTLFDFFEEKTRDTYMSLAMDAPGKYFIEMNGNNFDRNYFGEHKLVLEKVTYDYCKEYLDTDGSSYTDWERWVDIDRVCEVNYATTKPYLMQKSSFGATKAGDEIDLSDFYDIEGGNILDRTDLRDLMEIDAQDFNDSEVQGLVDNFVSKYEKLAVEIPKSERWSLLSRYQDVDRISVVPGRNIFVFEGHGGAMVLSQDDNNPKYPKSPYTIIVKDLDLYVEGDVDTNWMFIVDGKIGFQEKDAKSFCTKPQEVNGIFITQKGFTKSRFDDNKNGDVQRFDENSQLCEYGNLIVNWVLIWDNLEDLVQSRRSHLNDWFRIKHFDTADEERRDKLFEWAAVLIEYNPSLWSDLPPGAEDFTTALEVYKR